MLRRTLAYTKRVLLISFGCLAFIIGSSIFAWIAYNLFAAQPEPEFRRQFGQSALLSILQIFGGFCYSGAMVFVGVEWIRKGRMKGA